MPTRRKKLIASASLTDPVCGGAVDAAQSVPQKHTEKSVLTETAAAAFLGLRPSTLRGYRAKSWEQGRQIGPRFCEVRGSGDDPLIRYRLVDLLAWVDAGLVTDQALARGLHPSRASSKRPRATKKKKEDGGAQP